MANDWDKEKSTYAWKFLLDPEHPRNNPQKQYMWGYSKKIDQEENRNKLDLLKVKILMFKTHDYIAKSKSIGIFKSNSPLGFTDRATTFPILYLGRTDYKITAVVATKEDQIFWETMVDFLQKFYEALRLNKSTQDLLPGRKYDYSKDTYLDVSKWNFTSNKQLLEHCNKAAKHGLSYEAVNAFRMKYEEMKPFKETVIEVSAHAKVSSSMPVDQLSELRKTLYAGVVRNETETNMQKLRKIHGRK